jgi:hypothetical protein
MPAHRSCLERELSYLIALDLTMPGMDGLTALNTLRPSTEDIPAVLLTDHADKRDCITGFKLGADDYICKPLKPSELLALHQAVLRRQGPVPEPFAPQRRAPFSFSRITLDFRPRTLSLQDRAGATLRRRVPATEGFCEFAYAHAHTRAFAQVTLRTLARGHRPPHRRPGVAPAARPRDGTRLAPIHSNLEVSKSKPICRSINSCYPAYTIPYPNLHVVLS